MVEGNGLATLLCAPIADAPHEVARIAYLDRSGRVLDIAEHHGERDRLILSIRDVARAALACEAAMLVLVHNHPSGDATPSAYDLAFTRRLVGTMEGIGVRVHDHLIVAGRQGTSLRRAGLL